MKLKELTIEQVIEIAKLAFGHPDWIKSEITVQYQPYVEEHYEDAREYFKATFTAYFAGETTTEYRVEITPDLNVILWYVKSDMTHARILSALHTLNQREIQKKFTEYGF